MDKTIVGICGFGFTGSGAIIDSLEGVTEVEVIKDFEFSFVFKPDGLLDLKYHLFDNSNRYFSSDTAIRRFLNYCLAYSKKYDSLTEGKYTKLINSYIESLTQVKWTGKCEGHYLEASKMKRFIGYRGIKKIRHILGKYYPHSWNYPEKTMYLSVEPPDFMKLSRNLVEDLISSFQRTEGESKRIIVLDQPFSADHPQRSFPFFENPLAIIVHKDPRDLYLLAKLFLGQSGSFIPSKDVDSFIEYYKQIMIHSDMDEDKSIIHIHFEDLVLKTDETYKMIGEFLKINYLELYHGAFNPRQSSANIMLYKKYTEYDSDIKKIEKSLACWLYPFDEERICEYNWNKCF